MQKLADFQHPLVRQTAERLTSGAQSARGKLECMFRFVRDEIAFGFAPEGDLVKASETIERGYGQCNTKGILFLALCKAAGLDARLHFSGISREIQKGFFTGPAYRLMPAQISHSWLEVEVDGQWHRIDSYINDLPLHRAAVREIGRRGWQTGFSVSRANGPPSAELVLDDAHFSQMAAVTDDHGIWDEPAEYFAGPRYLNRLGPMRSRIYRLLLPRINRRVAWLRSRKIPDKTQ